jgi:AcrR family transcriptional regulator
LIEMPEPLPHGPHGLSREEVSASQRSRMLLAMAQAVSENGYAATPVAEVLSRAHCSRETFYDHFANKEECFLAAYDAAADLVLLAMGDAVGQIPEEVRGPRELLGVTLKRYLETMALEPAFARTFMVEVYAAGDAALARRVAVQQRFVDQVIEWASAETASQRFACEMVVAALIGFVTHYICAGRAEELPSLHPELFGQIEAILSAQGLDEAFAEPAADGVA